MSKFYVNEYPVIFYESILKQFRLKNKKNFNLYLWTRKDAEDRHIIYTGALVDLKWNPLSKNNIDQYYIVLKKMKFSIKDSPEYIQKKCKIEIEKFIVEDEFND